MSEYIDDVINADGVDIDGVDEQNVADSAYDNGVEGGEVASSANNNSVDEPDVAEPAELSDVDFDEYIDGIMSGVITDDGDETAPPATQAEKKEAETELIPEKTVFKSFGTQEEYQAELDRIVSKRISNHRRAEQEYDELADELAQFYGVDDRTEAVKRFKEQMNQRKADERGLTVEEFTEQSETERKAKAYDKLETERARVQEVRERLFAEADQIKQSDNKFDLQSVYDTDTAFKADLDSTGSVYLAYANKIKRDAAKKQTAPPQKQQKQRAFKEGALSSSSAGRVNTSAADLSDDEFEKYLKNIMNE